MKKICWIAVAAACACACADIAGNYNTWMGYLAGLNATGERTTVQGAGAGGEANGMNRTSFIGAAAGAYSVGATDCVGIGYHALRGSQNCTRCVAIGSNALKDAVGATDCVAIGSNARRFAGDETGFVDINGVIWGNAETFGVASGWENVSAGGVNFSEAVRGSIGDVAETVSSRVATNVVKDIVRCFIEWEGGKLNVYVREGNARRRIGRVSLEQEKFFALNVNTSKEPNGWSTLLYFAAPTWTNVRWRIPWFSAYDGTEWRMTGAEMVEAGHEHAFEVGDYFVYVTPGASGTELTSWEIRVQVYDADATDYVPAWSRIEMEEVENPPPDLH